MSEFEWPDDVEDVELSLSGACGSASRFHPCWLLRAVQPVIRVCLPSGSLESLLDAARVH